MKTGLFSTSVIVGVIAIATASASASTSFTTAELTNMTVFTSKNLSQADPTQTFLITPNSPTGKYVDLVPMSGAAGSIGNLDPLATTPNGAYVYYDVNAADLAAFKTRLQANGNQLQEIGFNDNNQAWKLGIWYTTGASTDPTTFVTNVATVANGANTSLSLSTIPTTITHIGVFIDVSILQQDVFHASWNPVPQAGVPEPGSLAVWSTLMMVGLVGAGIRRKALRR